MSSCTDNLEMSGRCIPFIARTYVVRARFESANEGREGVAKCEKIRWQRVVEKLCRGDLERVCGSVSLTEFGA